MARLRLVTIMDNGDVGAELGAVVQDDETHKITFDGAPVVREVFDMVARVTGGRRAAFAHLAADGWSNGKVALRAEGS